MSDKDENPVAYDIDAEMQLIASEIDRLNGEHRAENKRQFGLGKKSVSLPILDTKGNEKYTVTVLINKDGSISDKDKKETMDKANKNLSSYDFDDDRKLTMEEVLPLQPSSEFSSRDARNFLKAQEQILKEHPDSKIAFSALKELVDRASDNQQLTIAEDKAIKNFMEVLKNKDDLKAYDFDGNGKLSLQEILPVQSGVPFTAETAGQLVLAAEKALNLAGQKDKDLTELKKQAEKAAENSTLTIAEDKGLMETLKSLGIKMKEGEQEKPVVKAENSPQSQIDRF